MINRPWIIAGAVAGLAAFALLVVLGTVVIMGDGQVTPGLLFFTLVDGVLWMSAIKLLGDAAALSRVERVTSGYVEGVGETVDRLAAVLPHKGYLQRIG